MSSTEVVVGIVVLFVLVVVMFVSVVLVIAVSTSRSRRVLEDAGPDRSTLEERLRELDDLHGRGVITDEERATTRARLLAEG
jgi:cytochrome c-type biogenesis protein CcmH/NrfG